METVIKHWGKCNSIYDCVDLYGEDVMRTFRRQETDLLKRVDFIAFNSRQLCDYKVSRLRMIRSKSYSVGCGCDYSRYIKEKDRNPNKKNKTIVFAGQLNYRFDMNLFCYLVKQNPDYNFVLIGKLFPEHRRKFSSIMKSSNVRYLGEVQKNEINKYFISANIGIIPYKTTYNTVKYCNPMKFYEYLNAGLSVVSTPILPVVENKSDYIRIAHSKYEFDRILKEMTVKSKQEVKMACKETVANNLWKVKIREIERIAEKTLRN